MNDQHLLPIAIMAHNEERLIGRALDSALSQKPPLGCRVEVVVIANGCTDGTERVVKAASTANPGRVHLIVLATKGKAHALEETQRHLAKRSVSTRIPCVVLLDADCFFDGTEVVVGCVNALGRERGLCVVATQCLPAWQVQFASRLLKHVYRAIAQISEWYPGNYISGGCYCIRLDAFLEARFPRNVAEDMFLSSWLDGWMYRDPGLRVYYQPCTGWHAEMRKRLRQEAFAENYETFFRGTRRAGHRIGRYSGVLADRYRWGGPSRRQVMRGFLRLERWGDRVGLVAHAAVRFACMLWVRRLKQGGGIREGQWQTRRDS
jgi:glycosyltransferase involved in cell wall biosynthesis